MFAFLIILISLAPGGLLKTAAGSSLTQYLPGFRQELPQAEVEQNQKMVDAFVTFVNDLKSAAQKNGPCLAPYTLPELKGYSIELSRVDEGKTFAILRNKKDQQMAQEEVQAGMCVVGGKTPEKNEWTSLTPVQMFVYHMTSRRVAVNKTKLPKKTDGFLAPRIF